MNNMNRDIVIFTGAGFSRSAGLPTMAEFGVESHLDHEGLVKHALSERDSSMFRHAAPMLVDTAETFEKFQKFLKCSFTLKSSDISNLETVFCIAEALLESGQKNINLDDRSYSMKQLIINIKMWLWKIYQQLPILNPSRKTDYQVYDQFFKLVTSKEIAKRITVISTNYDILYEYLSWKHGSACAYPICWNNQFIAGHGTKSYICQGNDSTKKTIICKLHGSVNFFEDNSKADGVLYISSDIGDHNPIGKSGPWLNKPALMAVDAIWNIREKYGEGITPSIIPPSYAKLARRPWLRALWNTALEALSKAKAIIFLGYSIPDSDGFMRALIHGAMANRINDKLPAVYVVDPCIKTHKRYESIFKKTKIGFEPQDFSTAIQSGLKRLFCELA